MHNFRFDRFITLRMARRHAQLQGEHVPWRVPILMYHGIVEAPGRDGKRGIHVCAEDFAAQMRYLQLAGYRCASVSAALAHLSCAKPEAKLVALTFDDAYRDFYTNAFPILRALGFTATVYVVSGLAQAATSAEDRYMSWSQIREISAAGIAIGSHSATHARLTDLSPAAMDREFAQSKYAIEAAIGEPVDSFSYPYGFPEHDQIFRGFARERLNAHGYENAVTTRIGRASQRSDCFALPRLPISGEDDLPLFAAKLQGAYDWLYLAQSARKALAGPRWEGWSRTVPMPASF